jgi:hypothetical protein
MKMFGKRSHDAALERRLRAERPRAAEELVDRLSGRILPRPRARQRLVPRVALVVGATAAIALSLGAAGAIGSATGSIQAFGRSVYHVVQPSPAHTTDSGLTRTTNVTLAENGLGSVTGRINNPTLSPFGFQYGLRIPICYQGHIVYVRLTELLWYFFHGGLPARDCYIHR